MPGIFPGEFPHPGEQCDPGKECRPGVLLDGNDDRLFERVADAL